MKTDGLNPATFLDMFLDLDFKPDFFLKKTRNSHLWNDPSSCPWGKILLICRESASKGAYQIGRNWNMVSFSFSKKGTF